MPRKERDAKFSPVKVRKLEVRRLNKSVNALLDQHEIIKANEPDQRIRRYLIDISELGGRFKREPKYKKQKGEKSE